MNRRRWFPSSRARTAFVVSSCLGVVNSVDHSAHAAGLPVSRGSQIAAEQALDWTKVHDIGNVHTAITNFGFVGSAPGSPFPWSSAPSLEWPAGGKVDYLFAAELWVGAIRDGEPLVSTAAPVLEFRPRDTPLDVMYEAYEGQAAGKRYPSRDADDDRDGRLDEDWLDGRDNDGDGAIDEDFAAISNQMLFAEFNDAESTDHGTDPDHNPLGVSVQQSSLAWSATLNDDFIGLDYTLCNMGVAPLESVYVGLFADFDAGPRDMAGHASDDWGGFWEGIRQARVGNSVRNVKISIGYIYDDDGDNGLTQGYVGILLLGGRKLGGRPEPPVGLANLRLSSDGTAFASDGDPANDSERYGVLDGSAPRSLPPANPRTGLRPSSRTRSAHDWRVVMSTEPFAGVAPGESIQARFALVVGRSFEGMVGNAVQAQLLYEGFWFDRDRDPKTGIDGRETPLCSPLEGAFRIDACDSACDAAPPGDPKCYVTVPADGCVWVNLDCASESSGVRTGVDGREHVVRWLADATTPVDLQDFHGTALDDHVLLTWRLSRHDDVRRIVVQRGDRPDGAFSSLSEPLEPALDMSYMVLASPRRDAWFRLLFEMSGGGREVSRAIHVVPVPGSTLALHVFSARDGDGPVEFHYRAPGPVHVGVFDVAGRLVRSLEGGAGSGVLLWDGRDGNGAQLAGGVYFVRMRSLELGLSKKVLLSRL